MRLTEWYDDGKDKGILVKEYPAKDTLKTLYLKYGDKTDYSDCEEGYLGMEKLKQYEDLEEQGKLLLLPIDENTPVYSIEYCCGENHDYKVGVCHRGFCKDCDKKSYYIKNGTAKQCTISEIGKSVFFTLQQAQQALTTFA